MKTERIEQKVDTANNENLDKIHKQVILQGRRDKGKVSLRIDKRTVILVNKKNKTKEYAESYQSRLEKARTVYTYSPKEKR